MAAYAATVLSSSTVFNVCRNLWFRPFFLNGLAGVFLGWFVGLFGLGRVDARVPALPDFSSVVLSGSLASTAVSLHVLCRYILRYFCRALSPRQPCLCTGFAVVQLHGLGRNVSSAVFLAGPRVWQQV